MSEDKRPVHEGYFWGIVVSTKDPKNKRRIQVRVPDVLGKTISEWAEPGSMTISKLKVGEKVWIRFLHSDLRYPQYFIPHNIKEFAYLVNDETELELTHPENPIRIRAPKGTAYLSGSSSSVHLSGGGVHHRGKDASGYVNSYATTHVDMSSADFKENIRALDFDPEQIVRDAPSRMWNYREEFDREQQTRVGPLAETLPDFVLQDGKFVSPTAMIGVLWAAVDQLSRKVEELQAEIEILKGG
ncbi:phage baseplate assembly protein V [Nonomuraea sp. SYSU D8015]|uniref:phage baseplate assembly protein V n=1 Tax=Nonomuraea sp. SYSU D8015 TaxID=2593644 RepID=UPI0016608A4A|nr:phage baseplate assembly protein V [Nonomuraea sp. SYSU D8015]